MPIHNTIQAVARVSKRCGATRGDGIWVLAEVVGMDPEGSGGPDEHGRFVLVTLDAVEQTSHRDNVASMAWGWAADLRVFGARRRRAAPRAPRRTAAAGAPRGSRLVACARTAPWSPRPSCKMPGVPSAALRDWHPRNLSADLDLSCISPGVASGDGGHLFHGRPLQRGPDAKFPQPPPGHATTSRRLSRCKYL